MLFALPISVGSADEKASEDFPPDSLFDKEDPAKTDLKEQDKTDKPYVSDAAAEESEEEGSSEPAEEAPAAVPEEEPEPVAQSAADEDLVVEEAPVSDADAAAAPLPDKIDNALEEAEQKMAEQDALIEKARKHLNIVEESQNAAAAASAPPVSSTALLQSSDPRKLADQAALIYKDKREYERAYEMADEALRLDPSNKKAQKLLQKIDYDMEHRIVDLAPEKRRFQPPDGVIAYKIAVSDSVITLPEATEIAMKNSVQLESMKKRIVGAERKLTEARRALFPTVSGEVTSSGGLIAGGGYVGETWKLNLSQTVFDGGELIFTLKQAMANLESDKAKYAKERIEAIFRLSEAYRGTVSADYNMSYQSSLFEEVSQVKIRIEKEHEFKLVSEIDYLETQSTYNQVNFQKESAGSDFLNAQLILAQEMGLDPDVKIPIDTTLNYNEISIEAGQIRDLTQQHNWDIKIKELAVTGAYYALKIFDAKKMPKIELRGAVGLAGEGQTGAGFTNDLENEHFIGLEGSLPMGGNTFEYGYNRRFFAPTISSFLGSEDYKHRAAFFLLDKLGDLTDTEIAQADYLTAKADLDKEKINADVKAQEAFYNYKGALLQIATSLSKIKFREKQVNILRVTTGMQESGISALLQELIALQEDRFAYVKAIADIQSAVDNINRVIGIEDYYRSAPTDTI